MRRGPTSLPAPFAGFLTGNGYCFEVATLDLAGTAFPRRGSGAELTNSHACKCFSTLTFHLAPHIGLNARSELSGLQFLKSKAAICIKAKKKKKKTLLNSHAVHFYQVLFFSAKGLKPIADNFFFAIEPIFFLSLRLNCEVVQFCVSAVKPHTGRCVTKRIWSLRLSTPMKIDPHVPPFFFKSI